ncbi:hypothetical protein GHT06_010400 [Daphnia sinensis]|uniref:Uncharacterized protein n=1 Tax=Daphnia sinensis TaxID=1820382 RepID=A0AAD5L0D9_9CRUS|nr:hypothetical protein GHT06_010400 [Daphnia sinensis]
MEQVIEIVDSFARGDAIGALAETGRFLYIYNSTTLIASVGAIVGLILLGSLLWIAVASVAKTERVYNSYGSNTYRKTRSTENDEAGHTFMDLLAMLDDTFRKMHLNNFDCQKRAVCEAHQRRSATEPLGPFVRRIVYIFGKLDDKPLKALEPESADFLAKYFEAADNGRRDENCADLYSACSEVNIFNPIVHNSL